MEQRISLNTLATSDLDASRRFYVDGLGWAPDLEADDVLMMRAGEHLILSLWLQEAFEEEVGAIAPGPGLAPLTLAHNVGSAEEVDGGPASCPRGPARPSCLWRPIASGAGTAAILPTLMGTAGRSLGHLDPSMTPSCLETRSSRRSPKGSDSTKAPPLAWGRGLLSGTVSDAQWLPDSSSWCLCAASSSSGETGATRSSKKRRDNRPRTFSPPLILPFLSG